VAEQVSHVFEAEALLERVDSNRVAQRVGGHAGRQSGCLSVPLEELLDPKHRQAALVGRLAAREEERPEIATPPQIATKWREQISRKRVLPGIATFRPADSNSAAREVDVFEQNPRRLDGPQCEAVREAEERDVAKGPPGIHGSSKAFQLFLSEVARKRRLRRLRPTRSRPTSLRYRRDCGSGYRLLHNFHCRTSW
jgi:hypothetical protein